MVVKCVLLCIGCICVLNGLCLMECGLCVRKSVFCCFGGSDFVI